MAATTLEELYREHPEAREELESAPGYAVFSNIKMSTLWTTSGNGYGVAFDQKSGIEYDMRVFLFGGGIGIGLKDFRMVLIFSDTEEFASFVDGGWEFQSDMDVVVKSDDAGAAGSTGGVVDPKITAYRLTEAGVVAGASLAGTRYYLDDSR